MKNYYALRIFTKKDLSSLFSSKLENKEGLWELEITEEEDDPYFDFIPYFVFLLKEEEKSLEALGITTDDINIIWLYEYDNECSLEILPGQMKLLADNNLSLCISCWQKGSTMNF